MARDHFTSLNPQFVPLPAWEAGFLASYLADRLARVRWVMCDGEWAGFIVFGEKPHSYLPRRIGYVYELFLASEHRRVGVGSRAAARALAELADAGCHRFDLEIM